MADQQPTVVEEGDIPPQPSADGGAQREEAASSDSESNTFYSKVLSTPPPSVMNGERIVSGEPHTSGTALQDVCMSVCLLTYVWPYTKNLNRTNRTYISNCKRAKALS